MQDVPLDRDPMVEMYRNMLFYRRFEERANLAYTQQKFSGFCHLHIGQEALNVGVQACLQPDDYVISGYRSHTQAIAKGVPAANVFAELFGKATGCCHGKGGSMHMFSKEHRFFGGHGIVGGQAPLAVGIGFKINYENEQSIVVCYLGDAAMNQGQVFEAMNMAATWKVPVLFIIENNLYGMGTAIHRTTSVDQLYKRALAFDMKHEMIDAMNVLTVHEHMKSTVALVRKNKEPFLVEAMTYRYKGHSVADPGTYRTKTELEDYQKQDPILQLQAELTRLGIAEETFKAWDKEARELVKNAESVADAAPLPDDQELWANVFADET